MSATPVREIARENPRPLAGGGTGTNALGRLFKLVMLLQAKSYPNAKELAERCEVSRRTIYRDLELLSEARVPVRFRPDRQGYELAKGFFLPPLNLDEEEALAILILARQWDGGDGLGLFRHAWNGAGKLVQALPQDVRERVVRAAEPFQCGTKPPVVPPHRKVIYEAVLEGLTRRLQLRLWYRNLETQVEDCTKFSIYRIVRSESLWHVVGRSSLHRRIEVIGVPWVQKAVLTDDPYTIPPRFNLVRFLGMSWGVQRPQVRYPVWLRFAPAAAPPAIEVSWSRGLNQTLLDDGRVDVQFIVDGLDELTRWVVGFGDDVEVLAPWELRRRLHAMAERLIGRYAPNSTPGSDAWAAAPLEPDLPAGPVGG
jgi:predicted DNA-binding transcriptional regulator YafY